MPKSTNNTEKKDLEDCIICKRRKISENYCNYHERAYLNVIEAYNEWKEGYGQLSFVKYLQKIIENPATGNWAKEVAEILLKKENSKKQEK